MKNRKISATLLTVMASVVWTSPSATAQQRRHGKTGRNPVAAQGISRNKSVQDYRDAGRPLIVGHTYSLESKILKENRDFRVALPSGYNGSDARYPVLYVLDGAANFPTVWNAAEFLSRNGKMPHVIVVGLHNMDVRVRDYTPRGVAKDGEGDRFLDFVENELVPYIDGRFRTLPFRILHGHSQGAFIASYALATRKDLFDWYLVMDLPPGRNGSYIEKTVKSYVSDEPDQFGRLVTVNAKWGWRAAEWTDLARSAPKDFYLDRIGFPEEDHNSLILPGTYAGLKSLFHDYEATETRTKTIADLKSQFAQKSLMYGFEVEIPKRLMMDNLTDLIAQHRGKDARALLDHYEHAYGKNRQLRNVVDETIRLGSLKETIEDVLSYVPPRPGDVREFLGTWEGYSMHEGGVPGSTKVEISVANGTVKARTYHKMGSETAWREGRDHVTMRLLGDGTLEWGIMNNLRPFVPMVHSVRLDGSTRLVGTMELRGMSFRALDLLFGGGSDEMPAIHLTLERIADRSHQ